MPVFLFAEAGGTQAFPRERGRGLLRLPGGSCVGNVYSQFFRQVVLGGLTDTAQLRLRAMQGTLHV